MKTAYLDCYAGISGDMALAALLDLGVPLEYLSEELGRLGLPEGSYSLSLHRTWRRGANALKLVVSVREEKSHRHYSEIVRMIEASGLTERAKELSMRIFGRLAEAEARAHCVGIEEVHFHEVGAVDSIVDIVGVAICLDFLQIEEIHASALPLGGGFVETAHGRLPVPAPATAELIQGLTVHGACGDGERVTPTGAAIVASLAGSSSKFSGMRLLKTGSGAGEKDFPDCPNILRIYLGEKEEMATSDTVIVAETNIDDSTPQILGYVMERLFGEGALDVFFTPVQMKKNRPATKLSFLSHPDKLDTLCSIVFSETSAIGIRCHEVSRIVMERFSEERETEFGGVRFKIVRHGGLPVRESPEYDDCREIAVRTGMPLSEVMRRVAKP